MFRKFFQIFWIAAILSGLAQSTHAQDHPQDHATDPLFDTITNSAREHQTQLDFDGIHFSGPAWDRLIEEGRNAHFFLIGEEHGIAENPKLAAALFLELQHAGYERLGIEISPTMAIELDDAIREGGMDALQAFYAQPGGEPAFFGMKEEAEMLVAIRQSSAHSDPIFWGFDYEVLSDRQLIEALRAMDMPVAARSALAELKDASDSSWARHSETGDPRFIFSFGGDAGLVRAVREAWPERDEHASRILHTLEETLAINALFLEGQNWASNSRRATLIRKNFLDYWHVQMSRGSMPKIMVKMGASHLVRGRSNSEAFDLGMLLPALAEINGTQTFSVLVLPGAQSQTAVFDPVTLAFNPAPPKDGYARDLAPLVAAASDEGFTLIDLRQLRGIRGLTQSTVNPNLLRTIMGYDMLLVMSGSTASSDLTE